MSRWKTDPLLGAIFSEVRALWSEVAGPSRPDLLRVDLRSADPWGAPSLEGALRDVWMVDDSGIRLAPILRREAFDPGPTRGDYFRYGLVSLSISADGHRVLLGFRPGPEVEGEILYDVDGDGESLSLVAPSESFSA